MEVKTIYIIHPDEESMFMMKQDGEKSKPMRKFKGKEPFEVTMDGNDIGEALVYGDEATKEQWDNF